MRRQIGPCVTGKHVDERCLSMAAQRDSVACFASTASRVGAPPRTIALLLGVRSTVRYISYGGIPELRMEDCSDFASVPEW